MKLALVVGTRPEIIKMAPIIRACIKRNIDFTLIHSNQHYSKNMDEVFFEELGLPRPNHNLDIHLGERVNQVGSILIRMEPVLAKEKPDLVLAQGDTNTVVAAALSAGHLNIPFGHVEAGLRSYDRSMPEENNRIVADQLAEYLFAVSPVQEKILLGEGIDSKKVTVVGNTVTDALMQNIELTERRRVLQELELESKKYFLITVHRAGNVDYEEPLKEILETLEGLQEKYKCPMVWPIHPRTVKKLQEFNLTLPKSVKTIDPVGYLDFLSLEKNAELIFTDSGGVQEEACILGVPCITLRDNTERPETVHVGSNILCGRSSNKVLEAAEHFLARNEYNWINPFGDGEAAERILDIIQTGQWRPLSRPIVLQNKTVSVIGLGYMGLPIACLFANAGFTVNGVDINETRVNQVNRGESPFEEPGLRELLKSAVESGRFQASTAPQPADVHFISVPTPVTDRKCDLSYVKAAALEVAKVARAGNLVILESTSRPGTCEKILKPIFAEVSNEIKIAYCPERAIPGNTIHELVHNDRVVGGVTPDASRMAKEVLEKISQGEVFLTTATNAEAVKLLENTYRDVNIALANELEVVSQDLGFNVWEAIRLANRHPRVNLHQPGPGVGGHCIAVDPWFLCEGTDQAKLIKLSREINDSRPQKVVEEMLRLANQTGAKKIGVLGAAYKKDVDDTRESPSKPIVDGLIKSGKEVRVHDPFVLDWDYEIERDLQALRDWADCFLLVTDHSAYLNFKCEKPLLDTRNVVSP